MFQPPPGQTPSSLREAANFINAYAEGRTLAELSRTIAAEIAAHRGELNALAAALDASSVSSSALHAENIEWCAL